MGSASSSAKRKNKVVSAKVEPSEDIRAIKLLKELAQRLEDIRSSRKHLQKHIEEVHRRKQASYDYEADASAMSHGNGKQVVTDLVDEVVEDLTDYVDKISLAFDDLQGSLELFHDAIVKMVEKSIADARKLNVKEDIRDIKKRVEDRIKLTKNKIAGIKQQNVTRDVLKSLDAELAQDLKLKEDLDQHYKNLSDKRKKLVDDLETRNVDTSTVEQILQWKENVVKLNYTYGNIVLEDDQLSEETKIQVKDLTEINKALQSEVGTLQLQCYESDKKSQEAKDIVQKVEEKILEERLSHEVEINALKSLIDKQNRLIKELGGESLGRSPSPQKLDARLYEPQLHDFASTRDGKTGKKETDESGPGHLKSHKSISLVKKEEEMKVSCDTKETGAEHENKDIEFDDSDKERTQSNKSKIPNNMQVTNSKTDQVAQIRYENDEDVERSKTDNSDVLTPSTIHVSTGVQVTEEQLGDSVKTILDEKELTSSDLGLSVKSEFFENNLQLTSDDEDCKSDDDISKCTKTLTDKNDATMKNDRIETIESPKERKLSEESPENRKTSTNYSPDSKNAIGSKTDESIIRGIILSSHSNTKGQTEMPISEEDDFPESFANMIQLVSKDECITTLETTAEDIHVYEGTTKEIIYKRNDGGVECAVAYHKGIGAVIRTANPDFGIDTIRVDIIDEVESNMLPDLVLGERPISFHLHIQQKEKINLDLKVNDIKLFVPHRPLKEYEEVTLIYSVNGGDWEDCDLSDEYPASIESDMDIVGTILPDITDVKLVVIARERMVDLMAGEGDLSYQSSFDESIRVHIGKDTFQSHTVAKLLVHHSHILGLQSAINMHKECRTISSCTAFISIVCASVTRTNIFVDLDIPRSGVDDDEECRYTMFWLSESGWKLADCTWDLVNRRLTVNLMPGSRSYRVIGIEVPNQIYMEDRLSAMKMLHEHTSHYQVCTFVRQRLDDPQQAIVMCLRSHLADQAISELKDKGFSMGNLISEPFCIMDCDVLSIDVTGNIIAKPVNSDKMTMTFYPQREMSTRLLLLLPLEADEDSNISSGTISILKHEVIINLINEAIVLQQRAILAEEPRRRGRKRKNFWVRPWLAADRRLLYGQYVTLMDGLRAEDTSSFFNFMRMEPAMFDERLQRVSPKISML